MMEWLITLFTRNKIAKILAVMGAFTLWLFVMENKNPMTTKTVTVPLTVLEMPENVIVKQDEEKVRIKLRGKRSAFGDMDDDDLQAVVSLSDVKEGRNLIRVHTVVPTGMEVESVSPDAVEVNVESIVSEDKDVSLFRTGNVPSNMTVASIDADTLYVKARGVKSAVDSVSKVIGYVGLNPDNTQDFDIDVPLSPVNEDGRVVENVSLSPSSVKVHVKLARSLSKKIVNVKPVLTGKLGSSLDVIDVNVLPALVEIAGDAAVIEKVNVLNTEPIALNDLKGSTRKTVSLVLPDGVTVTNKIVSVSIEIEEK